MTLQGYDSLLKAIDDFKSERITFREFASWIRGSAAQVGYELEYQGDFGNHLDAWLEFIEFCYLEDDWYDLGCSIGGFLEDSILNEPRPLLLPGNDRVVREQLARKKTGSTLKLHD